MAPRAHVRWSSAPPHTNECCALGVAHDDRCEPLRDIRRPVQLGQDIRCPAGGLALLGGYTLDDDGLQAADGNACVSHGRRWLGCRWPPWYELDREVPCSSRGLRALAQ